MLLPAPPLYPRKRRQRTNRRPPVAPAVAPTLVSAAFDAGEQALTLVFGGAVTVSGFEAAAVVVRDGDNVYNGAGGVIQVNPTTLTVGMVLDDVQPGTGVWLTATAATGIVSVVGAVAWAGVGDLGLPFP